MSSVQIALDINMNHLETNNWEPLERNLKDLMDALFEQGVLIKRCKKVKSSVRKINKKERFWLSMDFDGDK
jgi:hypothetical protein